MFGSGNKQSKPEKALEGAKLDSLIAGNVEIVGDVHFSGGLKIDGKVQGNVVCKQGTNGLLVLSDKGSVIGKVESYNAVINGMINGDLVAHNFLELQSKSKVSGNISYNQLQMECGAAIDGKISHLDEIKEKEKAAAQKKDQPATQETQPAKDGVRSEMAPDGVRSEMLEQAPKAPPSSPLFPQNQQPNPKVIVARTK